MTTGLVVVETRITTFLVVVSTFSVVDETSDVATVLGLNDGIRDVGIENPGDVRSENGEAVELEVKTELLNFAWS